MVQHTYKTNVAIWREERKTENVRCIFVRLPRERQFFRCLRALYYVPKTVFIYITVCLCQWHKLNETRKKKIICNIISLRNDVNDIQKKRASPRKMRIKNNKPPRELIINFSACCFCSVRYSLCFFSFCCCC